MSATTTRMVRRAHALMVSFDHDTIVVRNYLTRKAFDCHPQWLATLAELDDWIAWPALESKLTERGLPDPSAQIDLMLDAGGLVEENSAEAERDRMLADRWDFGESAAVYHFESLQSDKLPSLDGEELDSWFAFRTMTLGRPELTLENEGLARVTALPEVDASRGAMRLFSKRHSERELSGGELALADTGYLLFSGLGVREIAKIPERPPGEFALKMAPSGGARNPFEGYLYAQKVEGLARGLYHYGSRGHDLGLIAGDGDVPDLSRLFGNQAWTEHASAAIFLVAYMQRKMWKYATPSGLRAVTIEAGHIAQNILLAAADRDVAATPVAYIADDLLMETLGIDDPTVASIHAVVLGKRKT